MTRARCWYRLHPRASRSSGACERSAWIGLPGSWPRGRPRRCGPLLTCSRSSSSRRRRSRLRSDCGQHHLDLRRPAVAAVAHQRSIDGALRITCLSRRLSPARPDPEPPAATHVPRIGGRWLGGALTSQLTACLTSAAIFASSVAVSSFSANAVGHIEPSSRFALSLKPSVAYLVLNFCAGWKWQITLPSLA